MCAQLYLPYCVLSVPLPEILRPLRNVTVRFQQTVRLYCLALSRGALIYDWKRLDGNQLSSASTKSYIHKKYSDTNQVTITYELKIHKVKLSDEGWYCCMATNDGGYTEKCIWLEVDSKLKLNTYIFGSIMWLFTFSYSNYYSIAKVNYSQSW